MALNRWLARVEKDGKTLWFRGLEYEVTGYEGATDLLNGLGYDLDYAWFDSLDGGHYAHWVPEGARTGVRD